MAGSYAAIPQNVRVKRDPPTIIYCHPETDCATGAKASGAEGTGTKDTRASRLHWFSDSRIL